jgi:CRISPR-associated protein Cmr3
MSLPFTHLINLEPLGLLYGSSGRFLSADNLVGQAGEHFPPDSPAVAGLIAAQLPRAQVWDLHTAGPFWQRDGMLHLPTPLNLLQSSGAGADEGRAIEVRLRYRQAVDDAPEGWWPPGERPLPQKPRRGGWIALSDWLRQGESAIRVQASPWQAVPHLHPRLRSDKRVSAQENALFMELAIALEPGVSLSYLSSQPIPDGRYRFGGEGHLVELRCGPIPEQLRQLLSQPLSGSFALVTPGLWGGSRLSLREPLEPAERPGKNPRMPWHSNGRGPGILTDRPRPWRHRLGAGAAGSPRLSRGRWAVPAGSCYHLPPDLELPPWPEWPESWFPREGFSFKQLGTALALPLP